VSLKTLPCIQEPQEETQRKTQWTVKIERGIGREAGGASGKSMKDKGSIKDAGEAKVVGHGYK
jgi:hypothetical protein